MKIMFLSTWYPYPPDNGSKLRVYYLLRALVRVHSVTLISFAFGTARPEQPGDLESLGADIRVVPVDPFALNRAGLLHTFLSTRPVTSRPVPAMAQCAARELRAGAFDAIIASTEMMAAYALRTPSGAARILEEHNSMARWMYERYAEQTNLLRRLRCWGSWQKTRRYEAKLFDCFDLVTMVSEQDRVASQALPGYCGQVEIVPNGVDCTHNRPGIAQPRPNSLVYNGAMAYSANYGAMQWFLSEIYPRIRAQVPTVSLTITGSIKDVNVAGLALDNSVTLSGFVSDIRVPIAEATVCVVPLRQGGGTRLKILEAMALGTAVVSTTKGAEGLNVIHGEHLLLADDPATFAASTARLLADQALRERLARKARLFVEQHYDWVQIGQRFVQLIEQVIGERVNKLGMPHAYDRKRP